MTAIETSVAEDTVSVAVVFTVPRLAVIVALPAATPFARPVCSPIVAIEVGDETQLAVVVRFCVEPSL